MAAAAPAQVQPAIVPTAEVVGNAFVHQYYLILHQSPDLVHRFYHDSSKFGRPADSGVMSPMTTTTTMEAINEKILSLRFGEFRAEITTVDSQESYSGGVLVLVTGYLTKADNLRQKFTQTFFLAPQDKGYFVLNDVFRYVDDANQQNGYIDVETPAATQQDPSHLPENHISEPPAALPEEASEEEVCDPSENGDDLIEEEEMPVPEVVDAIPADSQLVADSEVVGDSDAKIEEEPKRSYAFIVKAMKENGAPFSSPASSPLKSAPKSDEQGTVAVTPVATSEAVLSTSNASENGNVQDSEGDGPSIYVKNLPLDATPLLLEDEFRKFGPIRPNGIQVRCQKGFCFGFVEFDVASAVHSAIEASPIMIRGYRVVVEEKRSTMRGNIRGRVSSGAGAGYRSEGGRGRGNYGGNKAYGRGEYGNRTEYGNRNGNRGGYSNRGGDGYRRTDKMGNNNSGRGSRAGGLAYDAAAKNIAPRVSATA